MLALGGIPRGDVVRAKLAKLNLTEADIGDTVAWARTGVAVKAGSKPRRHQ